jgi:hypothetical protein
LYDLDGFGQNVRLNSSGQEWTGLIRGVGTWPMPRQALPAAPPVEEGRLRARPSDRKRPMADVTPKRRAVQAAAEVLSGRMSKARAMEEFLVSSDQLKWFLKRLTDRGVEDKRISMSPAFSAPGSGYTDLSFESSAASNHRTSWDDYCAAYRLTVGDLLGIAREPWERAFNLHNCLEAWNLIGVQPFTRRVYWDLIRAEAERAQIAGEVEIDPELLTVHGMVRVLFPNAKKLAPTKGKGGTIHSRDIWHLPGGATGDEATEIVRESTEAKRAKEASVAAKKQKRAEQQQRKVAEGNALGSRVVQALVHAKQIDQLKVDQLRSALAFRGVKHDPKVLKPALRSLLADDLKLTCEGNAPTFVLPSAPEPGRGSIACS